MRIFTRKLLGFILFSTIVFVTLVIVFVRLLPPEIARYGFNQEWLKVHQRIVASKRKIPQDTLYIGGSVGGQVVPFNNENSLTCPGAILPMGNYFLVKNALQNNPHINTVMYLCYHKALCLPITRKRTHQYFVKPFLTYDNIEEIMDEPYSYKILKRNKLLWLNLIDAYKILALDDYNYYDGAAITSDNLSKGSVIWLRKIKQLCDSKGVNLHLISPPITKSSKEQYSGWSGIKQQVSGTELEDLLDTYLTSIMYLPDSLSRDGNHWKNVFMDKHRDTLLKDMKHRLRSELGYYDKGQTVRDSN